MDNQLNKLPMGVTQLPSGSFRRRFSINGKRISKTNKSLEALMEETDKMISDAENMKAVNLNKLTFDQYYTFLINEFRMRSQRTTTINRKDSIYFSRIQHAFGKRLLESVSVFEVNRFYFDMIDSGLKISYCNTVFGVLNEIFDSAVSMHLIQYNPCTAIKLRTKDSNAGARSLSLNELHTLFSVILKGTEYCDLLKVMLLTGLRVGEAEALRFSSIKQYNDSSCIITVTATLGRYYSEKFNDLVTYYHSPKTSSGVRDVLCTKEVYDIFKKNKQLYERARKLKGKSWGSARIIAGDLIENEEEVIIDDFIFLDKNGHPMLTSNINSSIAYHVAKYNASATNKLDTVSTHDFRKTFATLANEMGISHLTLQKLMGHKSFNTTANSYIDLNIDENTAELQGFYDKYAELFTDI